jgi:hypothetical protein
LQFELSQATDPDQMAELSQRAGELRDNLKRANEQASVFAAGSPFEQTNNALGLMSSQIMSLDFEGAAESAKLFATAAKGINGQLIATQLKSLGSVVLSVGKAFMSMGAALLTNPIFLIAAVITGVVVVIGVLLNKLGLLKPILNAVGAAFKVVKDVIMSVVQAIKDFLDWMGLTSFAAEEAAERQAKAQEKIAQAHEDKRKKLIGAYEQEIALANIAGENTFELERKKQLAIILTSREQYKALEIQRKVAIAMGGAAAEQAKKINDSMIALREGIEGARKEIELINAKEVADTKKKNTEVEKSNKDSYAKRIEDAKKYAEERLAVQRLIRDLEISIIDESFEKEIISINEKYFRIIEDIQKNEKITSDERKRLIDLYAQEEALARGEAQEKYASEESTDTGLLPPPEVFGEQMDGIVAITEEGFSNMDKVRMAFSENFNETFDGVLNAAGATFDGISSLAAAFAGSTEASQEKAFKIQKAANIAQATMDTYKGAVGAFTQSVSTFPAPVGAILGAIQAAAVVAMGVANIKKIASTKRTGGGTPSASVGTSAASSVPSVAPQANLFGQGNNMNNLSASQPNQQNITVTAVVSETEITSTQNKIKGIKQMSEL